MGRRMDFAEEEATSSSSSLTEALLFTTLCIVGLPVEVHIKDGSVYSGIFHTASVHKGYGVVLKKAMMIRKGTHNANVPSEGLIETLVVFPKDLVQVVAKGFMLPTGIVSSAACSDITERSGHVDFSQCYENEAAAGEVMNQEREVGLVRHQEDEDGHDHYSESAKEASEVNGGASPSSNGFCSEHKSNQLANGNPAATEASPNIKLVNQLHGTHVPKEFIRSESVTLGFSDSFKPESGAAHGGLTPSAEMTHQNAAVNKTSKESKLNPGAKVFSPSFSNLRSTPPLVPTVPSMAYAPNSIPALQVAVAQPEVGMRPILPRSSWPIKVFPYVSTPTNADNGLQYSQPNAGYIPSRPPSMRHGAQYQPFQAMHPYIHPNPQNAMFGRAGQVVYVHTITPDMVQGPATHTQAPHPFLASHPIHVAKHEGVLGGQALQISATPPLVTNVPQTFTIPSHVQLSQPLFSSMLPFPILSSNVPYAAKFP